MMKLLPLFLVLLIVVECVVAFCPASNRETTTRCRSKFQLKSSSDNTNNNGIQYLGKGADALVRPGVVLIPPSYEFSTYLRECALFIHAMGFDEKLETDVIRGVVIDYPTAFNMGEMSAIEGALSDNVIYRGGSEGGDSVMMLHSFEGAARDEIGSSGIYEGGLQEAMQACDDGTANPQQFKFFFNYCQFRAQELEDILAEEEDGDAWVSVQVPPEMVLNWNLDRGECWKQLRNGVRQHVRTPDE